MKIRPPALLNTDFALRCFVAFTRLVDKPGILLADFRQRRLAVRLADEFRICKASDGKSWVVEAICHSAYESRRFDLPSMIVHDAKRPFDAHRWALARARGRWSRIEGWPTHRGLETRCKP